MSSIFSGVRIIDLSKVFSGPEDFDLYWYDSNNGVKNTILKKPNTLFEIDSWNKDSSEFLYSSQKYTPLSTDPCPQAENGEIEFFVYNLETKSTTKVTSKNDQINKWNPIRENFMKEKNLNSEKDPSTTVSYLGSTHP